MSDSDEESVISVRRPYGHGRDIFRKPDELIEENEEEEDETAENNSVIQLVQLN